MIYLSFVRASCNVNFFMFLPPDTDTNAVGDLAITNIYPDGAFQFQATNTFSFAITSSADIAAGDITVAVNATNLAGQGSSQTPTSGSGLTVGGTPTSRTVTFALTTNMMYNVLIAATDASGAGASTNILFDTITPAFTFEAEDWNYTDDTDPGNPIAGRFIDNPQTNAYSGLTATAEIDFHRAGGDGGAAYGGRLALATENAGDIPRVTHVGLDDFDIGNAYGGNWANYTRTFPAGTFNIYVRASRGDGGSAANAGSISEVTGADTED